MRFCAWSFANHSKLVFNLNLNMATATARTLTEHLDTHIAIECLGVSVLLACMNREIA